MKALHDRNKEMLAKSAETISECFGSGDFKKAKETVIKMKYYNSVMAYINNLLRERGVVDWFLNFVSVIKQSVINL